jgi:hypothetical protein
MKVGIADFVYVVVSLIISAIFLPLGFIWEEASSSFGGGRELAKAIAEQTHKKIELRTKRT